MKKNGLFFLLMGVTAMCMAMPTPWFLQEQRIHYTDNPVINEILSDFSSDQTDLEATLPPFNELKLMLRREALTLNSAVINKVIATLECSAPYHFDQNNILTVIDYSIPSSEKRLW